MSNPDRPVRPIPDPEVTTKPQRRRFTAEYKADVLRQADACAPGTGELGALLRREGLYSSHLRSWRAQREQGAFAALQPRKRGRKPMSKDPRSEELELLRRENARLERELAQARTIIGVQKKLSELLGSSAPEAGDKEPSE